MKKWLFILISALLALCCTRELDPVLSEDALQEDGAPDGRVRVTFSISMPESSAGTKALGEESNLVTMHLAVFGSSGYYKEYIPATKVSGPTPISKTFYDKNGNPFVKTVDSYVYQADIKLSNTPRTIHFLGNGPSSIKIGNSRDVLPNLLGDRETAFWQMISLPEISAQTDEDGNYLNSHGVPRTGPGDDYLVSDETQAYFEGDGIALIRNWAKIILRNSPNSHFTPKAFAVVNYPKYGTVVPYGGTDGFISNYQKLGFDDLYKDHLYKGNLPEGTEFNHVVPDLADFTTYDPAYDPNTYDGGELPDGIDPDDEPAVYLYERPVPNSSTEPTYVIIYGRYYDPEDPGLSQEEIAAGGVDCYYKIDLMDDGEYYPIFRNFKYQIQIRSISSRGHLTAASAAASAGSADVSADVNASHLADISDGTRRLAVQPWMSYTFIRGDEMIKERLWVKFFKNIKEDTPRPTTDVGNVWCEVTPAGGGAIVNDKVFVTPHSDLDDPNYGFYGLSFAICDPGESASTQTIRIYAKADLSDTEEKPMYRDVVITVQPKQPLKVSCRYPRMLRYTGQEQIIDLTIPDGLVQSMFPLVFTVEPQDMTLTPDNSKGNMPVLSGKSIVEGQEDRSIFHFERTVTWDEYNSVRPTTDFEDESRWRTFSCYFKTNCDYSGTTVWVKDREFFNAASATFWDYRSFKDPKFTTPIPRNTTEQVGVSFGVQKEAGAYQRVYVDLKNLDYVSVNGDQIHWYQNSSFLTFIPTSDDVVLNVIPTVTSGDVELTMYTDDDSYEPVTLEPMHFTNVGFVDAHKMTNENKYSNVAFQHVNYQNGKTVLFGYRIDPDSKDNLPNIRVKSLTRLSISNNQNEYTSANGYNLKNVSRGNPYTGDEFYYWFNMKTTGDSSADVSFTLSAIGYVEENVVAHRFKNPSNIFTLDWNAVNLQTFFSDTKLSYITYTTEASISCYFNVQFDKISGVNSSGIVLGAGGTYNMTVDISGKNGAETPCGLFYIEIDYQPKNGVPQKPRFAEPLAPDESVYYNYLGSASEYIWSLPRDSKTGTIQMRAPASSDIVISRIVLKSFRGDLWD